MLFRKEACTLNWNQGADEIQALKAGLPIAYVLDYCNIPVERGEGRLHAACMFHNDHDPSFDVYPWRGGERWGCFVCGKGGDVLDLIGRLWPELSFQQTKEAAGNLIAGMNSAGWTAPKLMPGREFDAARAAEMLTEARSNPEGRVLLQDWLTRRGAPYRADWLEHTFGVVVLNQSILIPYWNTEQELVALKHRSLSGGKPLAMAGSKLTGVFYGDWVVSPSYADSYLTEGESDTWTARWLKKEDKILGLPTGAGTRPFGLERLTGFIHLWFDGDVAGREGEVRWQIALEEVGRTAFRGEAPDGEDLSSFHRVNS